MELLKLNIFKKLVFGILSTDGYVKELIAKILTSGDIDCVIVKDAVEQEKVKKRYRPLKQRLFSDIAPHAIYRKDISTNSINKP